MEITKEKFKNLISNNGISPYVIFSQLQRKIFKLKDKLKSANKRLTNLQGIIELRNQTIVRLEKENQKSIKQFPREMFVRKDENSEWTIRTVIGINSKNIAIALYDRVNLSNITDRNSIYFWNFYREIDDKIEVSMKEIAKKFNIPIDSIKIID